MDTRYNKPRKLHAPLEGCQNTVKISSPNNQFNFDVCMDNHTPNFSKLARVEELKNCESHKIIQLRSTRNFNDGNTLGIISIPSNSSRYRLKHFNLLCSMLLRISLLW